MLITRDQSLEEALAIIKHEIHRGALDKKHPFRYCIMSTFGETFPESRYVVLRKVDQDLNCFIHTDSRSQKINEIKSDHHCTLLFYHPSKKLQIRLKGKILSEPDTSKLRTSMSANARKAYSSVKAPGKKISKPQEAWIWSENDEGKHFSVLKIIPVEIDLLQLSAQQHLRANFKFSDNNWKGSWLVP